MTGSKAIAVPGLPAASALSGHCPGAQDILGSYVARISERDHQASDGYPLQSAAQMLRCDR